MRRLLIAGAAFGVLLLASAAVAIASDWSIEHTLNPTDGSGSELLGVSCVSARACTAVGSSFTVIGAGATLAERWNGTQWSIEHTPNTDGASGLDSVSCVSARACTAVGAYTFLGYANGTPAERSRG